MRFILLSAFAILLFSACSGSKDPQPPVKPDPAPAPKQNPEPEPEPEPEPKPAPKPEVSLHEAARSGNLEVIRQFIDNGTDLDQEEPVFGSALNNAIAYNQVEVVETLIKGEANVNIKKKSDGNTPVHNAAFFAYPEILKLLLDAGAEKAPKNLKGELPIGIAMVPWEDAQGIYLLIQGILNGITGEPRVPMDMARIREALPEIFELLSDSPNAAGGVFFDAVFNDDVEAIKKAVAAGDDIDQRSEDGSTALLTAAALGRSEAAIALINGGADTDMKNQRGDTPLMVASFLCREEIVKALLENGADKDIANIDGNRPIDAVAAPWSKELEELYGFVEKAIGNIELDLEIIRETRPKIADMLR